MRGLWDAQEKGKVFTRCDPSRADVVITSYATLRSAKVAEERPRVQKLADGSLALLHQTPARITQRPAREFLANFRVWRLVLDEAQAVSASQSVTQSALARISRVNSWCVTGTPVNNRLNDLHGLLAFLEQKPFGGAYGHGEVDAGRDAFVAEVLEPFRER